MHYPLRLLLSAPPSVRLQPETFAYVAAVEAQDGQALEPSVVSALDAFVVGCKTDGTWNAIKASCILAGARTLSGALVPLVGTAPTNFNFVSGDYNRKTGLVGDGTTKYLDSNRNNNADPQNSFHASVFISTISTGTQVHMGTADGTGALTLSSGSGQFFHRNRSTSVGTFGTNSAPNFTGVTRSSGSQFTIRANSASAVSVIASETPANQNVSIYRRTAQTPLFSSARLAFYSIGESLDLALLDARVTTLINAFAAAIP